VTTKRRIGVVTGTRADYGLLKGVLEEIAGDPKLELVLMVTGAHLSAEHGSTAAAIAADGFTPAAEIDMLHGSDSVVDVTKSLGRGIIGFADAYARLRPDIVLVLGDRFEIFAAAQAAVVARIPLAHLHGGELTEGAMDEALRHAMTKMAQIHFVSHEDHGRRVVQMGENPAHVFVTGAPGLDQVRRIKPMTRAELEESLGGFRLGKINFVVTYHPETLTGEDSVRQVAELLAGLESVEGARFVVTGVNSDPNNRAIARRLEAWVAADKNRAVMIQSLGQRRYLSCLALFDAVIGNSSSGIIEAPSFRIPTVNVGRRQQGRLRPRSVIDVACRCEEIAAGIARALAPEFRASLAGMENPYGDGFASRRIVSVLRSIPLEGVVIKRFRDLPMEQISLPRELAPTA
jgi:UDP-hydrolysing UDP-N-acetyl-D-glucosamine 2-epimerase